MNVANALKNTMYNLQQDVQSVRRTNVFSRTQSIFLAIMLVTLVALKQLVSSSSIGTSLCCNILPSGEPLRTLCTTG